MNGGLMTHKMRNDTVFWKREFNLNPNWKLALHWNIIGNDDRVALHSTSVRLIPVLHHDLSALQILNNRDVFCKGCTPNSGAG